MVVQRPIPGLLMAIILLPVVAFPAVIQSVSTRGNSSVSARDLQEQLSSRPVSDFSKAVLDRDIRTIADYYALLGFLSVRVDSVGLRYSADSASVDIVFHIHEGKKAIIGGRQVSGNTLLTSEDIVEELHLTVGEPLDAALLEENIDALLVRYERLGRPFAACRIANLRLRSEGDTDSLDVFLVVDEGKAVTIDEIRVEGNSETDPDVIVREARLRPGTLFDPEKVTAFQQRLQRLNIFSSVAEPQLYVRNEVGGLLIRVQEGRSNTFDGAIGYVPGTGEETRGFFAGLASVTMRNLFGTGRKFSFRWEKENRETQELGVNYLEPWLFGLPVNVGFGFFQRQQDTSFVRRSLELKGELLVTEEFSAGLLFESDNVIPSAEAVAGRVLKTSIQTFGAELLYDTRDDHLSPTSGTRYRTDYQFGTQHASDIPPSLKESVRERVEVQKIGLDLDFYVSTFSRQVVAIGLHGKEIRNGQVDEGQMYRFGGTRTMRGYRENQFLGTRIAWTNTEYRFLLARRTFVYGFLDTGYYFRPAQIAQSIPQAEGFKYGYGLGLLVETSLGHLGVSYALGEGDSFTNGKIHFGLINEF